MNERTKSLLLGAAVAALLILPARAGDDWVTWPQRTFGGAHALKVEDFVGTLNVSVTNGGPIAVSVAGTRERINHVELHGSGDSVRIEGQNDESVWDWKNWFNFDYSRARPDQLVVKVSVPRGTEVTVDDMVGKANIGDTMGPLKFDASATQTKIGRVSSAKISLAGTGRIDLAAVNGPLDLDIAGSGKVNVGPTQMVRADIAGAGDTALGPIAQGLSVDIAGSGDISASRVNGPVKVDIAGSGSVNIADGLADPLHVDIMGSGNFTFGGMAVNPHVSSFGSGTVKIKAYRGHMSSEGMADVDVGVAEATAAAAKAAARAGAEAGRAAAKASAAAARAAAKAAHPHHNDDNNNDGDDE